jgi:hypothetical protein
MTLRLSPLSRIIRAWLAPLFVSTLIIGCGPSGVGTIKAGSKEEVSHELFPKVEGKKAPKGDGPQSGPTATPPGRKKN